MFCITNKALKIRISAGPLPYKHMKQICAISMIFRALWKHTEKVVLQAQKCQSNIATTGGF